MSPNNLTVFETIGILSDRADLLMGADLVLMVADRC